MTGKSRFFSVCMNRPMSIELTLYSRNGCHLCEDMEAQLATLAAEHGFSVRRVDIDSEPALVEAYGSRVPVLMQQQQWICDYFLDYPALMKALEQA